MNMRFVTMIMMLPNSLKEKNLLSWQLINSSHTKMWNWRSSLRANPLYPLIAYIGHGIIDPRWYETAIIFKPAVQWNKWCFNHSEWFYIWGFRKMPVFLHFTISTNLKSHIYIHHQCGACLYLFQHCHWRMKSLLSPVEQWNGVSGCISLKTCM